MLSSLQVLAFEGQNMKFTMNMFAFKFYIVTLGPAVIRTVSKYSTCRLILDSFLSRIKSLPLIVFLRGCRSFTLRYNVATHLSRDS